jgi:hypothetical protein
VGYPGVAGAQRRKTVERVGEAPSCGASGSWFRRMVAAKGVYEPARKAVRDLAGAVQSSLRNHNGECRERWRGHDRALAAQTGSAGILHLCNLGSYKLPLAEPAEPELCRCP